MGDELEDNESRAQSKFEWRPDDVVILTPEEVKSLFAKDEVSDSQHSEDE